MIAKFYNCAPAGDPGRKLQLPRELSALAKSGPRVIGLCEAIGYDLPSLGGYRLIRDTSRPGRANVAAYVEKTHGLTDVQWHDLHETWSRTEHPGTHPARSWLELFLNDDQFIIGHQPPKGTDNTLRAQREGVNLVVGLMAPWIAHGNGRGKDRRRMALADWNRNKYDVGPGPAEIARRIGGEVNGSHIDAAVSRNFDVHEAIYVETVQGTTLRSDHPSALVVRVAA